jgi:hypothetical protein
MNTKHTGKMNWGIKCSCCNRFKSIKDAKVKTNRMLRP